MTYTDAEFNLAYKEILERVLVNKTPSSSVLVSSQFHFNGF